MKISKIFAAGFIAASCLTASACANTPGKDSMGADLTIEIRADGTTITEDYRLVCHEGQPAEGSNHPRAAASCEVLKNHGETLLALPRKDQICTEIYGGPQEATITGTLNGQQVLKQLGRKNGCEISEWKVFEPLVGPGGAQGI